MSLFAEWLERERETLSLYEPLPKAKAFHFSPAHEIALSGANRAGKTLTSSAEVAWAATGTHPVRDKYPHTDLRIACVGADGRHLALMYSYLFEKPPFKIFKHPKTYQWTVVNENNPEHRLYRDWWEDADPLIPDRLLKGGSKKRAVAWESEKEKIPKRIELANGTVLQFYSGYARNIPKGIKFHLVWIDEEIDYAKRWLEEMRARIQDYNGYIFWSATPQNATQEFLDIQLAAEHPDNASRPPSEQSGFFVLLSADNFYLSEAGREAFRKKLEHDDEQMQIRFFGVSARSFMIVYPEFNTKKHVIPAPTLRHADTIYLIFDPGVHEAGVLFCMCPEIIEKESELAKLTEHEKKYRTRPGCIVVFDELVIRQASADMVAQLAREKLDTHPHRRVQDLTIDRMGSKTVGWKGLQIGENPGTVYMEKLLKVGIVPVVPGWQYGSNDKNYGVERTKDYLGLDDEELPHLFIAEHCARIQHEFKAWKKKRDAKDVFIGYEEYNNTLLDCLRYGTTRGLQWVPPPQAAGPKPFDRTALRETMRNLRSGAAFFK